MLRILVIFSTLCLMGGANTVMASETCPDVPGAAMLFERATTRVVWVGETHGTAEMPALFGDLVCVASTTHRPIVVALERGMDEQALWDRFLDSDGGAGARAALLKGSNWTDATQDGRSSEAMLALAERLREYKAQHRIVGVRLLQRRPKTSDFRAEYELVMANAVIDVVRRYPDALVLVYTGAAHAMRIRAPWEKTFALAASLIPASELVTVGLIGGSGQAWGCQIPTALTSSVAASQAHCGANPEPGSDHPRGIIMVAAVADDYSKNNAAGFDAIGYTGLTSTASAPAVATGGRH